MTMTPISSSEMLKQFLEDQVQTDSITSTAHSEPSNAMTTIMTPPTQATPQSLPETHQSVPNLINSLLQQSSTPQMNSSVLAPQHTNCNGFSDGTTNQLLTNLLKPPDVGNQTPVSNTPLQSVNIGDPTLTDVFNQIMANTEVTKEPVVTETPPMMTTAYTCTGNTNAENPGILAGAFPTEAVTMVTSSGLQTNSFAASGNPSAPLSNACIISVIANNSNLVTVKSETVPQCVGQAANVFTEDHHASANPALNQAVTSNPQPTMPTGIGASITSSDSPVKMIATPAPAQQTQSDLPADLANVKLQMFPPVSSLPSGNIGPQSVFVSNTNRQTNSDVPPTDTHASFNQGPFSTNSNFASTNVTNFLNVEIPDQAQTAMSDEIRDILVNDKKPKLTLQANSARTEQQQQQHSMLRQMLTNNNEVDNSSLSPSPVSSPEDNVPESASSISSPNSVFHDPVSQLTLINKSADLHIGGQDDDAVTDMWDISCFKADPLETDVPNKVQKSKHHSDAHSDLQSEISVEKLFDAGGADSTMDFKFTKFGQENQALFTFGSSKNVSASPSATTDVRTPSLAPAAETGSLKSMAPPIQKPHGRKVKDTGLGAQFPARTPNYELRITSQPEEQHRARYLTEGSRGAVKDRSQQGHPVVKENAYKSPKEDVYSIDLKPLQLLGHSDQVTLQVFVGNETGRVKPHGFYQACKVCGKNSTPSTEKEIDGTVVIETEMSPASDMTVSVDCVGILKLRNADVEKRIGVAKARAKKKNSTRARLIFRVTFQKKDGNFQTLQVASSPIICTQPVGQPEISRMSLEEAPSTGGQDLFIIGKNFLKGTQVKFQEISTEDGKTLWETEADIDQEYFQQTHLICKIPEYRMKNIPKPVIVQIIIMCRGKVSESQEFYYNPLPSLPSEVPMETDQNQSKNSLPCVSPVALELNRLVERTQNSPATSTNLFQLPPGAVPGIAPITTAQASQIPTLAVQPIVKQEVEMIPSPIPTPMETSQASPQHQSLQKPVQTQQQQQPMQTRQQQHQQQPMQMQQQMQTQTLQQQPIQTLQQPMQTQQQSMQTQQPMHTQQQSMQTQQQPMQMQPQQQQLMQAQQQLMQAQSQQQQSMQTQPQQLMQIQQEQPLQIQQQQQTQTNNLFNKTILDLLNATNQQAQQTSPSVGNQPNPGIILLSSNGQTPQATTTLPNQPVSGALQSAPMIVILPGNSQTSSPVLQTPTTQTNMQQMESILKSILGQQNGLS